MPWPCHLIERVPGRVPEIGDMWFARQMIEGDYAAYYREHYLSPEYFRDWEGKRPPIVVQLPGGVAWCPDSCASDSPNGWTVAGQPPNLTATPSINAVGIYHGHLLNGVLTDDVEGRTFL